MNRRFGLLVVLILLFGLVMSQCGRPAGASPAEQVAQQSDAPRSEAQAAQLAEEPSCQNGFIVTVSNVLDPSVHPDTIVVVYTDCDTLELRDVEGVAGQVTTGYVAGSTIIDIDIFAGPDGKTSIDVDTDIVISTATPTPTGTSTPEPSDTPTPTNTAVPTETPSATPTVITPTETTVPTETPTATVTGTPAATETAQPTPTATPKDPRLPACLRINFEIGGDVARRGTYVVREVGGHVLATWWADEGWTDSGWFYDIDITFPSVYVQVFFVKGDGTEIEMAILNPAPSTSYGWLARGQCHALEVGWPAATQ